MRFIPGVTKLTDFIDSLGEKPPLNSCPWSVTNDLKVCWAYITISNNDVTFNNGDGFYSWTKEEVGSSVLTATYLSEFDALPAVFCVPICASGTAAARLYGMAEDGSSYTRSTSQQSFYLLDSTAAALVDDSSTSVDCFVMAVGVDADTTPITDRSDSTPLAFINSLNMIVSIGNYLNPELIDDTCPVISVGYTTTTANAGDTLANIANLTNHSRAAAGTYTTDFNSNYYLPPMIGLITPMGDGGTPDGAYGTSNVTVETLSVWATDGTNNTAADINYSMLSIGLMEVA